MHVTVSATSAADADVQLLLVPVFADDDSGASVVPGLADLLGHARFRGALGEQLLAAVQGAGRSRAVLVLGIGPRSDASLDTLRQALGDAMPRLGRFETAGVVLPEGLGSAAATAGAAGEGVLLGAYAAARGGDNHDDPFMTQRLELLVRAGDDVAAAQRSAQIADTTSACVNWARRLIDAPAADITPAALAQHAHELAQQSGLEITVRDVPELRAGGFGGILAVGQGSSQPPRLIEARHAGSNGRTIALVGKGITFDAGGLMVKTKQQMATMRTDMAGAATVLAVAAAAARLSCPTGVVAIVPAAENMPSGSAYRPGDVIRHRGGLTSEVIDTDAEGRIVLADALAYATELAPEAVVDVATLTYDVVHALGDQISGIFGTDDRMVDELVRAGAAVGEPLWRLPLWAGYRRNIASDVATVRNDGCTTADAIHAALFLAEFAQGVRWAHLDIAGTAYVDPGHPHRPAGATGTAVRTLIHWLLDAS